MRQNASHPYPGANYEGATQAGSFRHGEKQFVSWLHLVLSLVTLITGQLIEGSTQAESWPNRFTQAVSWLHLGVRSTPYPGDEL